MYISYYTVYIFCYLCIFWIINKTKKKSKDFLSTLYMKGILWRKLTVGSLQIFESFVDGFIPHVIDTELPAELLKASLNIALFQFELNKRDRLLRHGPSTSHFNAVIQRMPMPTSTKSMKLLATDYFVNEKFCDIAEEDSDSDRSVRETCFIDNQPPVPPKHKGLTLRKSSRKNLLDRHNSIVSCNLPGFVSNGPMDPEELRQALQNIQNTLDLLTGGLPYQGGHHSRRQSTKSSRYNTDEYNV